MGKFPTEMVATTEAAWPGGKNTDSVTSWPLA